MAISSVLGSCGSGARIPAPAPTTEPAPNPVTTHRELLTQEEAKRILHYAFAAPAISSNQWREWLAPSGYDHLNPRLLPASILPGEMQARDFCFFDPQTGLKVAFFRKNDQLLVTFGALNAHITEVEEGEKKLYLRKVIQAAAYNLLWNRPLAFQRAHELIENLRALPDLRDLEIILTGQSFGGGVASYVALKTDLQAFCFNSLPIGPWLQGDVGREKMDLASRKIVQISVETDWLSDHFLSRISYYLPSIVPSPSIPGKRLFLPTAYPGTWSETHSYIVGSLLTFTGFDSSQKPAEIMASL